MIEEQNSQQQRPEIGRWKFVVDEGINAKKWLLAISFIAIFVLICIEIYSFNQIFSQQVQTYQGLPFNFDANKLAAQIRLFLEFVILSLIFVGAIVTSRDN